MNQVRRHLFHYLLEMTIASLNSLRQFWRRAVRPPLVMTALVPCRWWKRRSLVVLAPPTEQGLPGDMAVGPSELSSGRGGRSTDERRGRRGYIVRSYFSKEMSPCFSSSLSYPCRPWWWPEQPVHRGRPRRRHSEGRSRLPDPEPHRLQRSGGCRLLSELHLLCHPPARRDKGFLTRKTALETVRSIMGGWISRKADCELWNQENVTHLEPVKIVSVLVQDCCSIVHYTIPRHHPRPCKI